KGTVAVDDYYRRRHRQVLGIARAATGDSNAAAWQVGRKVRKRKQGSSGVQRGDLGGRGMIVVLQEGNASSGWKSHRKQRRVGKKEWAIVVRAKARVRYGSTKQRWHCCAPVRKKEWATIASSSGGKWWGEEEEGIMVIEEGMTEEEAIGARGRREGRRGKGGLGCVRGGWEEEAVASGSWRLELAGIAGGWLRLEIVYPCIPDLNGENEGSQVSASLVVSIRWISASKLLQSDLTTIAQREGGE
ncbi:hypothetical protein B296_00019424, partial [Ensete ventricosum]